MKKLLIAALTLFTLSSSLLAKECYNSNSLDVRWMSFKTLAKIGVAGNFSKTHFTLANKNASSLQKMLKGATVTLSLADLDAHNPLKNSNIATFFVKNLASKKIEATIASVDAKQLGVSITLNKKTLTIPMSYKVLDSKVVAVGVIDAVDFDLVPALRTLNTNVAGHKNKGWNDISIAFEMPFTSVCK